ncbi:MAG: phospho-N-acetylmuramoyl-pentapeptide-transferase [Candidatus Gracilibacteria bacterium]|nr:phospho-N-acetylmuramoyl-pentapeptide-transferase [Candidatus Gracilibacteria bacterium]
MEHVPSLIFIFAFSALTFLIAFLLTPAFTAFLYRNKLGKQIRETAVDGKEAVLFRQLHIKKTGTPTMGGILVWGVVALVTFGSYFLNEFTDLEISIWNRGQTYLPLFTLVATGILGAIDDYFNIRGIGKEKGLGFRPKLFWLTLFASLGAWWFYSKLGYDSIHLPGIGDFLVGWWYIPIFIFIIISSANAVNITDGLDGLAGGLLVIAFGSFAIIAYVKGLILLATFCAMTGGALTAFLWFNIPPARFIMGDTGALSLGATLGVVAMLLNSVIVLPLIGFVFVIETLSCIVQLLSKKYLGRKVFHIAPIHHHFEHLGWPEYKVTMRFWIVGGVMAILGLIIGLIGMGVS